MRILFLILAFAVTGCDTINLQQYRLTAATPGDAAKVKQVLGIVAAQAGLEDCTTNSLVPDTLVFYTQPSVQHFRVDLGARMVANALVVDLNAGFGPMPSEFKMARRLLTPALTNEFGPRLAVAPLGHELVPMRIK